MNYILGLIIAFGTVSLALRHLGQGAENYWDFVAFAMVIGGTVAVAVIIMPWAQVKIIGRYLGKLLFSWQPNYQNFVVRCMNTIQNYQQSSNIELDKNSSFEEKLLSEGFELLKLNIKKEHIEAILYERIHQYVQSSSKVANSVLSLGKYPPAFGLMGTVLGLVELMKGVSAGMPAKETGTKMAIALVATMYGLLVANLFINPAGEQIRKVIKEEERMAQIALQAVLLAADDLNLIEAQEMLNSMVEQSERVDFVALNQSFSEEAA